MVDVVNGNEYESCQDLSTNELGGYFLAYKDRHGRMLNGKLPISSFQTTLGNIVDEA